MRAVILDGSRDGREAQTTARGIVTREVEARADEVTTYALRKMDIRHCLGCFGCWIKTPGECVIVDDEAHAIAGAVVQSDLVVYFTPVTFGGYSAELKKVLDRMICLVSPDYKVIDGETHHRTRYERYPCLLGVGLLGSADAESEGIFRTLVERNAINMHSSAQASGVLHSDGGPAQMQTEIRQLLDELEVTK